MKVINADTFEEFDIEELPSKFWKWFNDNYEEMLKAQAFYKATTKPPGTPMPDLYSQLARTEYLRDPFFKTWHGAAKPKFHMDRELPTEWARDTYNRQGKVHPMREPTKEDEELMLKRFFGVDDIKDVDYSQVEVRLLYQMIEGCCRRGEDYHAAYARQIFSLPPGSAVTPEQRASAKSMLFVKLYGPSPDINQEDNHEEQKSGSDRDRYRRVGRSHCGCQNRGGNRAGKRRGGNRSYRSLGHYRRGNSRIVG